MTDIPFYFFIASCILFTAKRILRYLRFLQQEGYDPKRFVRWIWDYFAFDRRGTIIVLGTAIAHFYFSGLAFFIGATLLLGWYLQEEDPRKRGKLKLKMTERSKRIYALTFAFYLLLQAGVSLNNYFLFWTGQIILFQLTPFLLVISVVILSFDENRRQKTFLKEAADKFGEVFPYVIGITGSYGKTSSKDALGNILQICLGSTFWPSKGVNTEMGITREIRDHLKKGVKYAVVEMGAYGKGSISKLCRLTPPHAGIITTVGVAHLARFGDQNTIREAKSELAKAIPLDGILVCNGDNPGTRRISQDHTKKTTLLYGFDNAKGDLDCWIKDWKITPEGTFFDLVWKGKEYKGKTPLMGKTALSNLGGCFSMACALGAQPEFVIAAIANLKPVDNRIQVHKEQGITYVRNAYNSNPEGFADALEVLKHLEGKNKVLMTPGMIELASLEDELHHNIGRKAAQVCTLVIIVGATNRDSLTRGLMSGGMAKECVIHVNKRGEALKEIEIRVKAGDVVLIENDLPDLYEAQEKY